MRWRIRIRAEYAETLKREGVENRMEPEYYELVTRPGCQEYNGIVAAMSDDIQRDEDGGRIFFSSTGRTLDARR